MPSCDVCQNAKGDVMVINRESEREAVEICPPERLARHEIISGPLDMRNTALLNDLWEIQLNSVEQETQGRSYVW